MAWEESLSSDVSCYNNEDIVATRAPLSVNEMISFPVKRWASGQGDFRRGRDQDVDIGNKMNGKFWTNGNTVQKHRPERTE
jgi:hypothetical protein